MKNPDYTPRKLPNVKFKKNNFSTIIYRYPNLSRFFQGFPRELNFNMLAHVIKHTYKYAGEEIVW